MRLPDTWQKQTSRLLRRRCGVFCGKNSLGGLAANNRSRGPWCVGCLAPEALGNCAPSASSGASARPLNLAVRRHLELLKRFLQWFVSGVALACGVALVAWISTWLNKPPSAVDSYKE